MEMVLINGTDSGRLDVRCLGIPLYAHPYHWQIGIDFSAVALWLRALCIDLVAAFLEVFSRSVVKSERWIHFRLICVFVCLFACLFVCCDKTWRVHPLGLRPPAETHPRPIRCAGSVCDCRGAHQVCYAAALRTDDSEVHPRPILGKQSTSWRFGSHHQTEPHTSRILSHLRVPPDST